MLFISILVCSCNIQKLLNGNQVLLDKNNLKVEGSLQPSVKENLTNYYKQYPNKKVLGLFNISLRLYALGSHGKSDNRLKRFLRDKLGNAPVIIDTTYIESTIKSLRSYLRTKGHYYPEITYEVKIRKNKRGTVIYHVKPGEYYRFGEYDLNVSDRAIYDLVRSKQNESKIVSGRRMDEENLLQEQQRILDLLHNNGYYYFSKDLIEFNIDTATKGSWHCYTAITIDNKSDLELHKKYFIDGLEIEIDNGKRNIVSDSMMVDSMVYKPNGFQLNPKVLKQNLFIRKSDEFRQFNLNRSYGRINDLNLFKFINFTAKTIDSTETGKIRYHLKLVPAAKYDFTIEPQAITSDQSNTLSSIYQSRSYGVAATAQLLDRNIFKNAELLSLTLRGSLESQGQVASSNFFNASELSLTAAITMPRTLLFPRLDQNINFTNTKTQISLTGSYESNIDYERRSLTTALTYRFNRRLTSYYLSPVEFSFIRSDLRSQTLINRSQTDIFLQNLFSNNVIASSRFGFTYSNKPVAKGLSFVFIKWDAIELAGNVLTLVNELSGSKKNQNGRYELLGVNYFQYIKTAIDFRYNTIYDQNNATVFRLFTGVMLPYGNSPVYTPFEKRFFVGGANSLRAWRPRTIGPGNYLVDNQIDHSGDIKIEANAEFRFNIYNHWLEGAVFADAGNVWSTKPKANGTGAEFLWDNFYKQLAMNTGFGTRLNFGVILLRFDFGLPIHDPTYAEPDRWVIRKFNSTWFFNNLYFNFGIGYPF